MSIKTMMHLITPYTAAILLLILIPLKQCTSQEPPTDLQQLNDDVLGLIVFKSSFHDPLNSLASWNEDDNSPCSWSYIKCNPRNSRVSDISLDGLSLSGKLGRGLEKLRSLKTISLAHNNLTGTLNHNYLSALPNLLRLNLSHNALTGNIPGTSSFSSLQFLDLSKNRFSGPLPDNIFENMTSLRFLSLAGNLLQGPIPSTLTQCADLNHLNLSGNQFSGNPNFTTGILSLSRLRTLDLSSNFLSGSVPDGVAKLHNLKELVLRNNRFSGYLPTDIGLCPHLNRFDLGENMFTGTLPESLQNLKELRFLSVSNNFITGNFPGWINKLSGLEYLDFSDNKMSGMIPDSITECVSLSVVRLRGNVFTGSVPDKLFQMKVEEVDFSRNELTGNGLMGEVPVLGNLRYLNMSWNRLESRIPPEIGYFQSLSVLDLRNSGLVGMIPGDICESGSLVIMQLDGNMLTGPIPDEIGNCSSLSLLSLSHNNLTGLIPRSMSMLSKLKILKLEVNQLSGEIPQDLGRLENLLIANLSYNRLVGRLPSGSIFPTLDASAIEGNLGICSPLLKGPCKLNVPKPLVLNPYAYGNQMGSGQSRDHSGSSGNTRHHRFLSVSAIVAISAAVMIAFGVLVISLVNALARRRIAFVDNALESMCSSSTRSSSLAAGKFIHFDSKYSSEWLSANLELILNKAAEIGGGVFGTVYKATLGEGGPELAIKKLVAENTLQYQEEFDREVKVLAKAKHPNLIQLKGYYWTPQLQLLVSDYAVGRSIQARLYDTSAPLSWPNRFKIVVGTAKGLAHLHHSFRPPIIHYNVKPSNILLDENLNAKISDFGLTRLLTKLDKHVVNNRFQSSPGYVAPELACQSLRVNEKCDVYGFGVLILELVTGRRPVEYGEDNVVILSDHVRVLLEQGNMLDCVDASMGAYPEEEVLPVLKLALVCTSQIPSSRPSMGEVVQILQVIQTPVPQRREGY